MALEWRAPEVAGAARLHRRLPDDLNAAEELIVGVGDALRVGFGVSLSVGVGDPLRVGFGVSLMLGVGDALRVGCGVRAVVAVGD
jgi:hypothetical protein